MQLMQGSFEPWAFQSALNPNGVFSQTGTDSFSYGASQTYQGSTLTFNNSNVVRTSDTTHGKRKGVKYIIKVL